jgi:hypothetical protein
MLRAFLQSFIGETAALIEVLRAELSLLRMSRIFNLFFQIPDGVSISSILIDESLRPFLISCYCISHDFSLTSLHNSDPT